MERYINASTLAQTTKQDEKSRAENYDPQMGKCLNIRASDVFDQPAHKHGVFSLRC